MLFRPNIQEAQISAIEPTEKNVKYFDFTRPLVHNAWKIISAKPEMSKTANVGAMLNVFDSHTWFWMGALFLTFPLLWVLALKLYKPKQDYLGNVYFDLVKVFFHQSVTIQRSTSHRIAWITIDLGSFILTSAFCGVLLSQLTLPDRPLTIDNFKDVLKYKRKLSIVRDSDVHHILKAATDPVLKSIWNRVHSENALLVYEDIDPISIREDMSATHATYLLPYQLIVEAAYTLELCDDSFKMYFSETSHFYINLPIAMRKDVHSNVKKQLQFLTVQATENGYLFLSMHQKMWMARKCIDEGDASGPAQLGLASFLTAFIVLGFGLTGSTLVLVAEKIAKHFTSN